MKNNNIPLPSIKHTLSELPRAGLECGKLFCYLPLLKKAHRGDQHPVLIIPGFGGGDGSTWFLRSWLQQQGFNAISWRLGTNLPKRDMKSLDDALRFRQHMVDHLAEQVDELYTQYGCKISLVGWSLGGLYATDLARDHPQQIRQVITLGTPHGDPRGTASWDILKWFYKGDTPDDQQNIAQWLGEPSTKNQPVPTSIVYSHSDGVVSTSSATHPHPQPHIEHIAVKSSHAGFTVNPKVYWIVANRLAQNEGQETALEPSSLPCFIR